MKKLIAVITLGLISASVCAADVSNIVGEKVDAVSNSAKSKTDKTATPVEGTTKAVGMEKTSKKVGHAKGKTKEKTNQGAAKIKKAAGSTETKVSDVNTEASKSKDNAIKDADQLMNTGSK